MRISEVIPGHHELLKRVGIHFDDRIHAVQAAVRLYREHNVDTEVLHASIYVEAPRVIAPHYQGVMELATGRRGWNEWDPSTLENDHNERLFTL